MKIKLKLGGLNYQEPNQESEIQYTPTEGRYAVSDSEISNHSEHVDDSVKVRLNTSDIIDPGPYDDDNDDNEDDDDDDDDDEDFNLPEGPYTASDHEMSDQPGKSNYPQTSNHQPPAYDDDPNDGSDPENSNHGSNASSKSCTRCGEEFEDVPALHNHIIDVHENSPQKKDARTKSKNEQILQNLRQSYSEEYDQQDDKTNEAFDPVLSIEPADIDVEPFEMLECMVQVDEPFACNKCDKRYTTKSGLLNHENTFHRGKKHKCNQCDKEYNSKASLNDHINSKHTGTTYKCDICDKTYATKNTLKDHKRSKHSGLVFNCARCGKNFSSKEGYAYHMKIPCKIKPVKEGPAGDFTCKTCGKQCTSKQSLWHHDRTVHKGKRYQCSECDKEFMYSSVLKKHIQSTHQGISHNCELCGKTFAYKSGLEFHIKKSH